MVAEIKKKQNSFCICITTESQPSKNRGLCKYLGAKFPTIIYIALFIPFRHYGIVRYIQLRVLLK